MPSIPNSSTRLTFAVVAAATLAACASGVVTVSRTDYANQYTPLEVGAAGGGDRQMKVSVIGNPFDTPKDQLDQAVVRSMQGRTSGIPVNFATNPENPDPARNYHVVVAFNPETLVDPARLCADSAETTATATGGNRVTLMGALCQSDLFLSHAIARADVPGGSDSPAFESLVAQLTFALFPAENPNLQEDAAPLLTN